MHHTGVNTGEDQPKTHHILPLWKHCHNIPVFGSSNCLLVSVLPGFLEVVPELVAVVFGGELGKLLGPLVSQAGVSLQEGRKEMFYLTTHSTHFIYGYMASDIWYRTIQIAS